MHNNAIKIVKKSNADNLYRTVVKTAPISKTLFKWYNLMVRYLNACLNRLNQLKLIFICLIENLLYFQRKLIFLLEIKNIYK